MTYKPEDKFELIAHYTNIAGVLCKLGEYANKEKEQKFQDLINLFSNFTNHEVAIFIRRIIGQNHGVGLEVLAYIDESFFAKAKLLSSGGLRDEEDTCLVEKLLVPTGCFDDMINMQPVKFDDILNALYDMSKTNEEIAETAFLYLEPGLLPGDIFADLRIENIKNFEQCCAKAKRLEIIEILNHKVTDKYPLANWNKLDLGKEVNNEAKDS